MAMQIIKALSRNEIDSNMTIGEIADELGCCFSYAELAVAPLRKAGVVVGRRGPGGGYKLNDAAVAEFTLFDLACIDSSPDSVRRVYPHITSEFFNTPVIDIIKNYGVPRQRCD